MKKVFIALMTALALTIFAACESKDNGTVSDETTTSAAEVTTTAEAEEETKAEETTSEETTSEETEAETESDAVEDTELFMGTGYTLAIDGEKWLDATEYLSLVAEFAENTEPAQYSNLTAEDLKNMGDAIYYHSANGSNFNVTVVEIGDFGTIDDAMLEQLGALMQEQYNAMTGYSCEGYKIVEVNGYKSLKFEVTADAALVGADLKMNAYLFYQGTHQTAVTYTAASSSFDESIADFEEVLNSISFE